MLPPTASRLIPLALTFVAAVSMGGCGGDQGPTTRIIYVSSSDCAEGGLIDFDKCAKAIDKAVTEHEKTAKRYPALVDCESIEGVDRCEKAAERHYRPRLMSYLFSINKARAVAAPLYAGSKGAPVFRSADGTVYDYERTEGVKFSRQAMQKSAGLLIADKKKAGKG
jgi:uncharacterized protein YgiB involved in biofilm formation